jgi:hypothetical protein
MCPQQLDHKPHNHPTPTSTSQPEQRAVTGDHKKDARIHCAILNKHTTTTTPPQHTHPTRVQLYGQAAIVTENPNPTNPRKTRGNRCMFVFSGPNRVSTATTNRTPPTVPYPHPTPQKGETGPGPTRPTKPLSVMTRQCLRHRAPPPHIRERRAPHPFSREGAP